MRMSISTSVAGFEIRRDILSIEAADALGQLWAQGVDLGEWTRTRQEAAA